MAKKPTERPEQVPYPASSRLADLLATLQPAAKPERPRPARQPKPVPKYYRTLTETDVKRLVHARFNSLTDCSTVHMSFPAIAKRHRLPVSTCFYAVRAYLQRGLAFVNRRLTNGRPAHTIKIKEQLTGFLLTHSTLQEWSGMTLLQRCKQIKNQFGVTISPSALKRFYNRQGIKYLRTSYCYQQGMGLAKEQERFKFCVDLATRLDQKEVLVYADEASFNCWMHSKRTWSGYD
jgi:transposase